MYKSLIQLLQTLTVSVDNVGVRDVVLRDDWVMAPIDVGAHFLHCFDLFSADPCTPGDVANLVGPFDATSTLSLTLDRLSGLLVLHPDILVSSTKVADSSHCARKALLQEMIRTTGGATPALVYGNMLHELMQACLVDERWDEDYRREKIDEIVGREVQTLWTMEVDVGTAREQMLEKSGGFEPFQSLFVGTTPGVHFPSFP